MDQSCLDIYKAYSNGEFSTFGCHGMGGNQFFAFAESGQIISVEDLCVSISTEQKTTTLVECSDQDRSQLWKYDDHVSKKNLKWEFCIIQKLFSDTVVFFYRIRGFYMQKLDFA